ncbi:MAG: hypothetical protein ACKVT0_05560 [Planctomycetaceae bacterium]
MNRIISIGKYARVWCVHLIIGGYLSLLGWGIIAHTFNFKQASHPGMYYLVWDMFCGWSAYDFRVHILAEGESGKIYELAPGPWGQYSPYGKLARHHYDTFCNAIMKQATNCLDHTRHEPITRIFCVEEAWAKKFNLPDSIWVKRYPEPRERYAYYHLRNIFDIDGNPLLTNANWYSYNYTRVMMDNPRLVSDSFRNQPYMVSGRNANAPNYVSSESNHQSAQSLSVGSPLGN